MLLYTLAADFTDLLILKPGAMSVRTTYFLGRQVMMMTTKRIALASLLTSLGMTQAIADPLVDAATDFTVHQGGNPLPAPGYARPPFHIRHNATKAPTGLSPMQIRKFYGFDAISNNGEGQVIAIIDAYDDPYIDGDLDTFSSTFGLPLCKHPTSFTPSPTECNFKKIYASGSKPRSNSGWALEISLDVEWAHAIAPNANIILVEAASNSFSDLTKAVDVAVQQYGATVVSMSFGGSEFSTETAYDYHFNVPDVTFTASSGDSGDGVEYPAASPNVVAVGGTTLVFNTDGSYNSETAWSGSGGGQSKYETPAPSYQSAIPGNPTRGVPDVAYGADPNTGFSVYDSVKYYGQTGWFQVGGTSAGAPQWAALFAIVNSLRANSSKVPVTDANSLLYTVYGTTAYASDFHDILAGSNGTCGAICNSSAGYDYVTGLGSPMAKSLSDTLDSAF